MSLERIKEEVKLLQACFPLEYREAGHWVRINNYPVDEQIWTCPVVDVAFQIPESIPAQQPYGFYVHPNLGLRSGETIDNYAYPAPTIFGDEWGKFSWQLLVWAPKADIVAGTNMVNFAHSIADRFREGR